MTKTKSWAGGRQVWRRGYRRYMTSKRWSERKEHLRLQHRGNYGGVWCLLHAVHLGELVRATELHHVRYPKPAEWTAKAVFFALRTQPHTDLIWLCAACHSKVTELHRRNGGKVELATKEFRPTGLGGDSYVVTKEAVIRRLRTLWSEEICSGTD